MNKLQKSLMTALLCLAALVSCNRPADPHGNDGTDNTGAGSAEQTVPAVQYKISYVYDMGNWDKIYYTPEELWDQFKEAYNGKGGKLDTPADLDTSKLESSDFAAIYSDTRFFIQWAWLYKAVWNVGGKESGVDPRTVNFASEEAVKYYLPQLCGFFSRSLHTDTHFGTSSLDFSDEKLVSAVTELGPAKDDGDGAVTYTAGTVTPLKGLHKIGYDFIGWDTGSGIINEIGADVTGDVELTAVWKEATKPSDVEFLNFPTDGIGIYRTLQLEWKVTPEDAYNKSVTMKSSDTSIFTVDSKGLISAKKSGTGKLRITLAANPDYEKEIEIKVTKGDYFDAQYLTESYTTVGSDISIRCSYVDCENKSHAVTWTSLTPDIATVDIGGTVHPLKAGLAAIRASYDEKHCLDFPVTVLGENVSDAMAFILKNHNSNALTVYNLGIGDGTPAYYYDVVGSVNNLLFDDLKIDRQYYGKLSSGQNNYGPMDSIEFVCVHYTGNMNKGADADNNASYFANPASGVSIHYVTGRSNQPQYGGDWSEDSYAAFAGINEEWGAWHASTGSNKCIWDKTGVAAGENDPEIPEISISDDLYYTINGQKTIIKIPAVPSGYVVNGNTVTAGGKTASAINAMGLITKVENGEYYLARTWWGKQRTPMALSTYGGNTNSVGIESCVDIGSDLMHTWHVTAQLVADILVRRNLGPERVVGHHFFSAKDCPQPLLENDLQLWNVFMDMVRAEYERITAFRDVKISARALSGTDILSDKGLLRQNADTNVVTYEVTVEKDGKTEKVTLATAVESFYSYDGPRTELSLQLQGYDIK